MICSGTRTERVARVLAYLERRGLLKGRSVDATLLTVQGHVTDEKSVDLVWQIGVEKVETNEGLDNFRPDY